ncbi:MAG: hypothetical protein AB8B65_11285 [Kordia sp.]|uniref:hypothetical protein n=1 Tax=Kordia sp. TaxID=1965332 RepID=UPI00385E0979
MDVLIFTIIGIGVAFSLYIVFKPTAKEKEAELQLKKSLDDDRIFDPETGVYISLEEAESGQWSTDDRETHYMPELQLSEEGDGLKEVIKYLNENDFYTKTGSLPDVEYPIIESSQILSKYEDWSYSSTFTFKNGLIFLPVVEDGLYGSLLMFLVKINSLKGHYYLREKETSEKFFDLLRKDDDLNLKNYESFTYRGSKNIQEINRFLKKFEGEKGLEIEINDTYLFIKTLKLANIDDIKRIERIVQKII